MSGKEEPSANENQKNQRPTVEQIKAELFRQNQIFKEMSTRRSHDIFKLKQMKVDLEAIQTDFLTIHTAMQTGFKAIETDFIALETDFAAIQTKIMGIEERFIAHIEDDVNRCREENETDSKDSEIPEEVADAEIEK